MKITRVTIHNFLKLKDVDFNPSQTNVIVGKNRQGKTSILKAIRAAFTGDADDTSIRIGGDKAEIVLELDELNVRRTITGKGNYLDISNKEGLKMPAPQKYLDGILGTFSFNPIEFFDKKPAERKKYLLNAIKMVLTPEQLKKYVGQDMIGIDFNKHALEVLEDVRKFFYDQRTVANAEVTKKEKALQAVSESIPADFDPSKVSEDNITKVRDALQKDEVERTKAEAHVREIQAMQKRESEIDAEIARLTEEKQSIAKKIVAALEVKFDYSDETTIAAVKDTLAKLEGQREHLFSHRKAEELRGELTTAISEAQKLDGIVKAVTKQAPEELIKEAKLPVEGLTIEGDDILINGVSLDNLSSSEQLRFGLQIVKALNGEFKVICIDGVELLDKESFEFFLKEIENDDYQYFVTRVDGDSPHSIVVDDGEIKKTNDQSNTNTPA